MDPDAESAGCLSTLERTHNLPRRPPSSHSGGVDRDGLHWPKLGASSWKVAAGLDQRGLAPPICFPGLPHWLEACCWRRVGLSFDRRGAPRHSSKEAPLSSMPRSEGRCKTQEGVEPSPSPMMGDAYRELLCRLLDATGFGQQRWGGSSPVPHQVPLPVCYSCVVHNAAPLPADLDLDPDEESAGSLSHLGPRPPAFRCEPPCRP